MSQDLYLSMLNRIEQQMSEHKSQTCELIEKVDKLHETLSAEVNTLKVAQSKCDSKWNVSEKFLGFSLGSGSLVGLLSWLFSSHTGK